LLGLVLGHFGGAERVGVEASALWNTPLRAVPMAVLDLEMTGLSPKHDRLCEVAVVRGTQASVECRMSSLVRPGVPCSEGARACHGLTDEELAAAPPFREVVDELEAILDGAVLVAHNVAFDLTYLEQAYKDLNRAMPVMATLDTLTVARRLFAFRKNNLAALCAEFGISNARHHRALGDANATFELLFAMLDVIDPSGTMTLGELDELVGALAPNSPLRLEQRKALTQAHRRRTTVWIGYKSTAHPKQGVVRREVGVWVVRMPKVQGWCFLRGGGRVFRLDRMLTVEPGERTYAIPSDFDRRI
jgi:DNA polymerase III epsilon subunit family exonuclease